MNEDTKAALETAHAALADALARVGEARALWDRDALLNKTGGANFPIPDKLPLSPVAGAATLAEMHKAGVGRG